MPTQKMEHLGFTLNSKEIKVNLTKVKQEKTFSVG